MNMESGTLVRWNEAKGFGFITPDLESQVGPSDDVFIHISTLKHMARKPMVGDYIEFEREQQADGKLRARRAHITGVAILAGAKERNQQGHSSSSHSSNSRATSYAPHGNRDSFRIAKGGRYNPPKSKFGSSIITVLLLIILGIYGFSQLSNSSKIAANASKVEPTQTQWQPAIKTIIASTRQNTQPSFSCEAGKTHCSHMRTCAEATFYLRNCPTTQMDGDNDGIPCERQHCRW